LTLSPWPLLSISGEQWSWHTHTKTKVQRSVGSKDRGETNGWTDRHYKLLYPPS